MEIVRDMQGCDLPKVAAPSVRPAAVTTADRINNRKPSGASESTVLGPFHVPAAPELPMGANICLDGKGHPMPINGCVLDIVDELIEGVKLDFQQTNDDGFYDVQQKGIQPDFNLRGVLRTGDDPARIAAEGAQGPFYEVVYDFVPGPAI